MDEDNAEAALVALLARCTESDDPAIADNAIDLYLASFGDDQDARRAALSRLTHAMLARPIEPPMMAAPSVFGVLRRGPI